MRKIRKRRTKPSGGQSPPYESRWHHFEVMTLICDSVKHRGLVNRIKMLCTLCSDKDNRFKKRLYSARSQIEVQNKAKQ